MAVVVRRADTQKNHEFDASDMPSLLRSVEDSRHFGRGSLETPSGLVMTTTSAFILTRPRPSGTDYDFTWYPAPGQGTGPSGAAGEIIGAIRECVCEAIDAQPVMEVTPSTCSSTTWSRIVLKIKNRFKLCEAEQPPCCLGPLAQCHPSQAMVWSPNKDENHPDHVNQMVSHLETELCPEGTRVWPVQSQGWLTAMLDCGAKGKIFIKSSKTDYVILTQEAWDKLHGLAQQGIQVTGDHLVDVLHHTIAFYEAKTDRALTANPGAAKRQGLLELLVGDAMRNCEDHLVVLAGDGNRHYAVHFSEKEGEADNVHISVQALLKRIAEAKGATTPAAKGATTPAARGSKIPAARSSDRQQLPRIDCGTLPLSKALLALALKRTEARLCSLQGGVAIGPGNAGAGGAASGPSSSGPHEDSNPGGPGSTGRAPGAALGRTLARQSSSSHVKHAAAATVCAEPAGPVHDEDADADMLEALQEQLTCQRLLQALQLPGMCGDLGLEAAPTALTPLTRSDYAKALHPMLPDGCGGWTPGQWLAAG